jgi:hypothetical protein
MQSALTNASAMAGVRCLQTSVDIDVKRRVVTKRLLGYPLAESFKLRT